MAPRNRRFNFPRARHTRYEAVETGYDPGQLVTLAEPANPPSPPPIRAKASVRHAARHDYKPTALRWWFHGVLILCLATFIGLTEYIIQTMQVYDGGDIVDLLWARGHSRRDSDSYQAERRAASTPTYFHHMPRNSSNTATNPVLQPGYTPTTSTSSTSFVVVDSSTSTTATSAPATLAHPDDRKTSTISTSSTTQELQSQQSHNGESVDTGISPVAPTTGAESTSTEDTRVYLHYHTSKQVQMQIGTSTSSTPGKVHTPQSSDAASTAEPSTTSTSSTRTYLHVGSTVSLSKGVTSTSTSSSTSAYIHIPAVVNVATSGGLQIGSTTYTRKPVITGAGSVRPQVSTANATSVPLQSTGGLTLGTTTSHKNGNGNASPVTSTADTSTSEIVIISIQDPPTTSDTTDATPSVQVVQETRTWAPSETRIEQTTTDSDGRTTVQAWTTTVPGGTSILQSTITAQSSDSQGDAVVTQQTSTWAPIETTIEQTTIDSEGRTTVQVSKTTIPGGTSVIQSTVATQSEGHQGFVAVVQQTSTWAPRETTIEQTTADSEGRTTVQALVTTVPGGTSVFQSTVATQSDGHQGYVAVIQQTETWAPRETTVERTTTDSKGRTIVQAWKSTLPGSTSVFPSTITVPLANHQGYVTVLQQTETWDSSVTTVERTTTDADGQVVVQTLETTIPAGTSVFRSSVSVLPGETLVTVPKAVPTTIGGSTKVIRMTMFDAQGHATVSSYTTVVGGTPTVTTQSYFVATSLPSGDAVITISTAVATTIGGTTEIEKTTFTGADGALTTSSFTTVLGGTLTYTTIPLVVATPVPSGDVLVSVQTVVPTTIGGTTEVLPTTLTNAQGQLTTSFYITVLHGTPTSTTEWTLAPTPTDPTGAPVNGTDPDGNADVVVYGIDLEQYLAGTFLPTVLAVMVGFLVKLISINARLMQPFHVLATADESHGATAESSMFLRFDRWHGAFSLSRAVKWRQPVVGITDLLGLCAMLLAPVAAGAIKVHVPADCQTQCIGSLQVSVLLARVLEGLMAVMVVLLAALVVRVSVLRWRTGVSQNPWSVAGMASLCLEPETRSKIRSIPRGMNGCVSDAAVLKALEGSRYRLGEFWTAPSPEMISSKGYGVVVAGHDGMGKLKGEDSDGDEVEKQLLKGDDSDGEEIDKSAAGGRRIQPFAPLTWWGRCVFLFLFSCTLILLVYYENTSGDSGFERFMDSQGVGISIFFTAVGGILGACMETVFRSVATVSPYLQLSNNFLPAERSILLSPPTNAFYGLYSAVRQRHLFFGVLSFTTILGELFLPVTLSQVPFSLLETSSTQVACAWLSIAILSLMVLVLAASFAIAWPHMPIDPRTVAGAMFYVCDSWLLETLHGMAAREKKDRDLDVKYQRHRYTYGYVDGAVGGRQRMGVELCDDSGEAAVILRRDKMLYG